MQIQKKNRKKKMSGFWQNLIIGFICFTVTILLAVGVTFFIKHMESNQDEILTEVRNGDSLLYNLIKTSRDNICDNRDLIDNHMNDETVAKKILDKVSRSRANRVKSLPDVVEDVIPGVVHIGNSGGQGSGFVVGPRLIKTARHMTENQSSFEITTNDGHKLHATRSIRSKEHDTSWIYIDDLTCQNKCEGEGPYGEKHLLGEHEVKLHVLQLKAVADCRLGETIFSIGSTYGEVHFNAVAQGVAE